MAGNRQRRGRRSQSNPGPKPTEPHRENVPGELDHASGEVEGFEAELVAGANGAADATTSEEQLEQLADESLGDLDDDGDVDEDDRELARPTRTARTAESHQRGVGGPRFWVFLKACWAELQRVQWPDRRQVAQATAVVVGFVIIAGAYLGFADWVAGELVDLII
jgi:preprotein translocase SecE subunit